MIDHFSLIPECHRTLLVLGEYEVLNALLVQGSLLSSCPEYITTYREIFTPFSKSIYDLGNFSYT